MKSGVYVLMKNKKVVYIGQTLNWPIRLSAHKDLDFNEARLIECPEAEVFILEQRLIKAFNPRYNQMYTPKRRSIIMTQQWVSDNADLIGSVVKGDVSQKTLSEKAIKDLKFSPRYASSDMMTRIMRLYENIKETA